MAIPLLTLLACSPTRGSPKEHYSAQSLVRGVAFSPAPPHVRLPQQRPHMLWVTRPFRHVRPLLSTWFKYVISVSPPGSNKIFLSSYNSLGVSKSHIKDPTPPMHKKPSARTTAVRFRFSCYGEFLCY